MMHHVDTLEIAGMQRGVHYSRRNARERIVATVRAMLRQRPLAAPSVQEIADATRISRRAIYNHFENAEAARRIVQHEMIRDLVMRLPRELDRTRPPQQAIPEFVHELARLMLLEDNRVLMIAIARRGSNSDVLAAAYDRAIRDRLVGNLEIYLLRRKLYGEFTTIDADLAARHLVTMVEASIATRHLFAPPIPAFPMMAAIFDFCATSFLRAHFQQSGSGRG